MHFASVNLRKKELNIHFEAIQFGQKL